MALTEKQIAIAERMKSYRNHLKDTQGGHSQGEIAAACGMTRSQYTAREDGISPTSADEIPAIAKALGVSINYLLGLDDTDTENAQVETTARGLRGFLSGHAPHVSRKAAKRLQEMLEDDNNDI